MVDNMVTVSCHSHGVVLRQVSKDVRGNKRGSELVRTMLTFRSPPRMLMRSMSELELGSFDLSVALCHSQMLQGLKPHLKLRSA